MDRWKDVDYAPSIVGYCECLYSQRARCAPILNDRLEFEVAKRVNVTRHLARKLAESVSTRAAGAAHCKDREVERLKGLSVHFLKQCAKSQFSERGLMPQCGVAMLYSMQAYDNRTAELRMQGFCSTPLGEHPFGNGCNLRPLCKGFRHDTCLSGKPCRTNRTLFERWKG